MFKKIMENETVKYIISAFCMIIVFSLTLSMGSSLSSYTKSLGTVATLNLYIGSTEKTIELTAGSGISTQLRSAPYNQATEIYVGNWSDYYTAVNSSAKNTVESYIDNVESFAAAGNAFSVSGMTGSFSATLFYNSSTKKAYILAPPNRKLYASADCRQMFVLGNASARNTKVTKIEFSSNFDTSRVTNFDTFFGYLSALTTINGLNYFNTAKATKMSQMFYYLPKITSLNLSSFNTAKVTNMHGMFVDLGATSLDITSFDNSALVYMGRMFSCDKLTTVYVSTKWKEKTYPTSTNSAAEEGTDENLKYSNYICFGDTSSGPLPLCNQNGDRSISVAQMKTYDPNNYRDAKYANWEWGYLTLKSGYGSAFTLTDASTVRARLRKSSSEAKPSTIPASSAYNATQIVVGNWREYGPTILDGGDAQRTHEYFESTPGDTWSAGSWTNGYIDSGNKGYVKVFWKESNKTLYILASAGNLVYLPANSSKIFWMGGAEESQADFNTSITSIYLRNCVASNVTNASGLFGNNRAMTSLPGGRYDLFAQLDQKCTDFSKMFHYCSALTRIDYIQNLTASKATTLSQMFYGATAIPTLNLSSMQPSNCTNFFKMFVSCTSLTKIYSNNWTIKSGANTQYMFLNLPLLTGQSGFSVGASTEGTGVNANTGSSGLFTSPSAAAILASIDLPDGYVSGIDLDMEPDIFSSEVSDEDAATVIAAAERATPKNYEFEGFVLFENSKNGYTEQVNSADLSFSINRYLSLYGGSLYVTPIYSQIPTEEEIELPFQLQKGYISGVELGVEPMIIDAPLEDFGDLFDILNWGEENVPEGYLLDTFMFYTDYMYKEMYIEDAFDFLDEHYADGADTVFKVTPVYMPDPDYEWPEEEEPVTEPTEGDEATTPDEGEGETSDEPVSGGDEGEGETPDEPTDGGEGTTPDAPESGDAPSEGEGSGTTDAPESGESGDGTTTEPETPDEGETPSETPSEPEVPEQPDAKEPETPSVTPDEPAGGGDSSGGDSGSSGGSGDSAPSVDTPSDSGSSSSGSDGGSSDSGSSDSGIGGAVLNLFGDAFRKLFSNVALTLFGGKTII